MLALLPYPFLHGQHEGNHSYLSKMSNGVGQMQAVVSSDFKGSLDVDVQKSQIKQQTTDLKLSSIAVAITIPYSVRL